MLTRTAFHGLLAANHVRQDIRLSCPKLSTVKPSPVDNFLPLPYSASSSISG